MTPTDPRRDAPSYHRNIGPILDVLKPELANIGGNALEVGSGQHIAAFGKTYPNLTWWPTEYAPDNLPSINAWVGTENLTNVMPAIQLDASLSDWALDRDGRPPNQLDVMFTANVIHISPWPVCEGIIQGAARHLTPGAKLFFYGPFLRADVSTAPGNLAFDEDLRARNPQWGIRNFEDVAAYAAAAGLQHVKLTEMPANNLILQFQKS